MRRMLILFAFALAAAPSCKPQSDGTCTTCGPMPKAKQEPIDFTLDDFLLTERDGTKKSLEDFKGKVWVASFVFTRCAGPCPQVTATMARLQAEMPDITLVTFTVDPERDDAKELRQYAERYQADAKRWLFLTGAEDEIHRLMSNGFKLGIAKNPNGKPGDEFDHSTRLAVVDKQGHVRGYFDGMSEDPAALTASLGQLKELVTKLREER